MIIDVNASLGPFAFRRLRNNTSDGLLRLMDSRKIDKAIVASASAITYRNPQAGNEEVDDEAGRHRDRLIPFSVINPTYAGWEDDLRICREDFGMRGVRLYPKWQNFGLSDARCLELVHAASERGMIVSIPIRVEDPRERSWLVNIPDLALDDVAGLIKSCPQARFLILNGLGFRNTPLGRKTGGLTANYCLEMSRLTALLDDELGSLIRDLGGERIVFGTGMPFSYPDPALLKLQVMSAGEEDRQRIAWKNIAQWLD
jgi:predicted TIM-barrel fold metal-dependent hydrolase